MYVVYYFYKVFDLKHLNFFATYGLLFFLFMPFVFLFVVPYLLTGDSRLSAKLTVVVPFCYGLGFIYSSARALILKFRTARQEGRLVNEPLYEHAIVAYISMVCWAALPVIVFFGDFQVLEHSVTNAGFLMMTIIYVKSAIRKSRNEYEQLKDSEFALQQLAKNLKKRVKRRTKKLEDVMEAKRTTFINLAHETKTPLTLINNYLSEYINKHGETEEIKVIRNNIKRLTNDIVNFFDVESYERGFSMYNHDRVSNFTSLLNDKVSLFTAAAKRKKIRLSAMVESGLYVKAHPGAVDRIVNNLLENAIKYSDEGSTIETGLRRVDDQVVFWVKDSGYGIPEEYKDKVFEPYYKLSVAGRNSEGMGMGLSIVKKVVTDLQGTISLNSEVGKGTEICVSLPIGSSIQLEVQDGISSDDINFAYNQILLEESLDGDKPFVLVVEDNIEMLNFLRNKLKPNYNVAVSRNGREAMERLQSLSSVDIIISDVMMNDMDGLEFCKAVNEIERYAHIPFIFLSAKSSAEDRLAGLNLGAVAYLEKPFKIEELMAKIQSIIINRKRQREAVVTKAYEAVFADKHMAHKTVSPKRCAFTDNCKKYHLTSREIEIIKLLIKGIPYKILSANLSISEKTVSKHVSNIFMKVGVNNKIELINKLEAQEVLTSSAPGDH